MSENAIQTAIFTEIATLAAAQSLTVAWPNVDYDPSSAIMYLQVFDLPAQAVAVGLSEGKRRPAILQIDIVFRDGAGIIAASTKAQAVLTFFNRGKTVTLSPSGCIRFDLPGYAGPLQQINPRGWAKIPVSIPYVYFE